MCFRYGQPQLQVMKECVVPYRVAFGLPKGSIHNAEISATIQHLLEAGLVNKWINEELESSAERKRAALSESESKKQALSADQLQAPIAIYCVMLLLSLVSFILEITLCNNVR